MLRVRHYCAIDLHAQRAAVTLLIVGEHAKHFDGDHGLPPMYEKRCSHLLPDVHGQRPWSIMDHQYCSGISAPDRSIGAEPFDHDDSEKAQVNPGQTDDPPQHGALSSCRTLGPDHLTIP
jgi:hypothetical protein